MNRSERSKMVGAAVLVATIAAPVPLCAATEGALGANSAHTFQAILTVMSAAESSVQVIGFEDIVLNTTTASNALQIDMPAMRLRKRSKFSQAPQVKETLVAKFH